MSVYRYSRYSSWNTKCWFMGTQGTVHETSNVGIGVLQVQFMEHHMLLNRYARYCSWNTKCWYRGTTGTVHGTPNVCIQVLKVQFMEHQMLV